MKELSLNILDIAMNSVAAGAGLIGIDLEETEDTLRITVTDNGCGMSPELVARVTDPFTTSRKTRKVGLGIPFFKLAAEQTGGSLCIQSKTAQEGPDHGTVISALFYKKHLDFTPLGDVISSIQTLIQGSEGESGGEGSRGFQKYDLRFTHTLPGGKVELDTRELRQVLGDDVPLSDPEVLVWIRDHLNEQYQTLQNKSAS